MLRFCERGISAEIQKFAKKATSFFFAKYSNIFYTVLPTVFFIQAD